ncbi:reverse transcriptase domain-containing protein [Nocardia sp. NPDC059239]|uniref:reverse transcriptase domain-containing protein n=1 Tax=Nocardia sp. NPDC059239 TaxID=3346785 RepID=UPI00368E78ED
MQKYFTAHGAISPALANLFMHYAFDLWLAREFPSVRFGRYADDAVIHCRNLQPSTNVLAALEDRMAGVGLRLHPDKTRIVYCKDSNRHGSYENTSFTFLGSTFRPRQSQRRDGMRFTAFLPAISKDALRKIGAAL